jgi:hypothetical protein
LGGFHQQSYWGTKPNIGCDINQTFSRTRHYDMGLSKIRITQDMQQLGMGETWAALREFGMML